MIVGPGFRVQHLDEVTRQQVRPGTVRRVWPYLRRYRGQMVLLLGVTAVDSAIVVVSTLILRLIIDDGILRHRESVVVTLALTIAGLALVDAGAEYVRSWYSLWIGESLVLELRTSVFRHVQRQPLAFFTRTQTGALVSRMNDDINETQQAVGVLMSQSVSMVLNLALVLAAMFWLSWQLSLIALAVIPLFVLPGKVTGKRAQRLLRQEMQLQGELATMTAERSDVSGALLAMLYGRPEEEAGQFTGKASRIRDLAVANAAGLQLLMAFIMLLTGLVTALVYGLGGTLVIHGVFQVGTLVAFIALVSQLYEPLHEVSSLPVDTLTALVSFDRVFEILDLEPLITERATAFPLPGAGGAPGVEVEGVWFRYPAADQVSLASLESVALPAPERPSDAWVLRDVTFQVPAGKLTALVGPSGAGKTTITHLVPRLYDPVRGAVRIGGHDVRDLTLESLRSAVGVVPQDAHLFHDTIRANLLYARPSATEKELTEACQAARIWEVISSLPDGLDTIAGDRGYRFSGGEKQRLALARLLLKAPSVVVLDEATAHLDSESEAAIQRALATALAGRTSLVIAHRLSTVRAADQILVVDGGQIAERGTHDELLAADGVYAGLYRTQFAPQAALRPLVDSAYRLLLTLTAEPGGLAQMPGDESGRVVRLEPRDAGVPAQIGVQRLLLGPEGVEQVQGRLPFHPFVVPLQQELHRNGDLPGLLDQGAWHETPGEENGGRYARLDHRQPNADGGHPLVPSRAADLGQRKERVQGGPPFRDRVFDQREDERVDDLVDRLAGCQRPAEVGPGLLVGGGTGPVTVPGGVDGGHREAVLRRVVPGPGHQPGESLVQAAVVAAQDQRGRCGCRRP
jgi:ATP-binding cassette subfamily B protein